MPAGAPARLGLVLVGTVVLGAGFDLFCLLLLPVRLSGHLVPAGPLLVLVGNALLASTANRLANDRIPAQVLLALAVVLSVMAVVRGPGGDLIVTRDLEGMYLVFVVAACLGPAVPLLRRSR